MNEPGNDDRSEPETAGQQAASSGVTPARARDHNERLVLSLIHRHGPLPGSELARRAGLSSQTASVILRALEADGIVRRGAAVRGRVGKPRVPFDLDPAGVLSLGLKIGRRSADLVLMDISGAVRARDRRAYPWPVPEEVFGFLGTALTRLTAALGTVERARITGLGIAAPFDLWDWSTALGAPEAALAGWRHLSLADRAAQVTDYAVLSENDATAAARAEHMFGLGRSLGDFAYIFIGTFVGGGLVLNGGIYPGGSGNAGAFGSLPVGEGGAQLIHAASIRQLEAQIRGSGRDPSALWAEPPDWSGNDRALAAWRARAGAHLARACVSIGAVIDVDTVVIDGAMPADQRRLLIEATAECLAQEDRRGLSPLRLLEGTIGRTAREVGAAAGPIAAEVLLEPRVPRL